MKSMMSEQLLFDIYQSLFTFNHDACYALDKEGNFTLFNQAAMDISGYSREEAVQMSFTELIQKNQLTKAIHYFHSALQGNREHFETSIWTKSRDSVDLSVTIVPISKEGEIIGLVGMAKDVTEEKRFEQLLVGQTKVLEMIASNSSLSEVLNHIIWTVEKVLNSGKCSVLLVNKKGTNLIHGASPNLPEEYSTYIDGISIGPNEGSCGTATFLKQPIIVSDIDSDPLWREYKDLAAEHGLKACWSYPIFFENEVLGTFAVYNEEPGHPKEMDIKIIKKATYITSLAIKHYQNEEKISHMAFHDELTGLPNRRFFNDKANTILHKFNGENDRVLGLLFLDLDRFKVINDSFGHNIGDLLLENAAERIKSSIKGNGFASRQGGDEFTIFLENVAEEEVKQIASNLLDAFSIPFSCNGREVIITPSIGISIHPLNSTTTEGSVDDLLRKADIAMYQAKKKGRNNYQFYDMLLDKETHERLDIENELRKAIKRNEFSVFYQPIINLETNKISGVEALIRWFHGRLGNVPPKKFIPIAEEIGIIDSIGEFVFRAACRQLKQWEEEGIMPLRMGVNLSVGQFYQSNLISVLETILKETGTNPAYLNIEITESMTMDVDAANGILHELRDLGLTISIDDFGTGYSSLSYLKSFPINYIKIDQSFITDIIKSKNDENIASTIILMAHHLGMGIVAEGVETKEQLHMLTKYKCNEVQGFLFSKPLPCDEFLQFYKEFNNKQDKQPETLF